MFVKQLSWRRNLSVLPKCVPTALFLKALYLLESRSLRGKLVTYGERCLPHPSLSLPMFRVSDRGWRDGRSHLPSFIHLLNDLISPSKMDAWKTDGSPHGVGSLGNRDELNSPPYWLLNDVMGKKVISHLTDRPLHPLLKLLAASRQLLSWQLPCASPGAEFDCWLLVALKEANMKNLVCFRSENEAKICGGWCKVQLI